jgi:type I restriction enzyme M protein
VGFLDGAARREGHHGATQNQTQYKPPSALPLAPTAEERLDVAALETWLWDAACAIRGATDAPKVAM